MNIADEHFVTSCSCEGRGLSDHGENGNLNKNRLAEGAVTHESHNRLPWQNKPTPSELIPELFRQPTLLSRVCNPNSKNTKNVRLRCIFSQQSILHAPFNCTPELS
ncbi:hypothetical protein CAPTEDRAFT_186120 [Capitella teleta]|uniref:Uncharacterized protein n=1 Tax=Capitella teleta TaxID=283909 RepID=R7V9K4_CAPTE|nr:hypothetical protein CAPTEDRAFT_186120 [Capitella teleta]|eukprot:ELU15533.1 hypothetical protein CAPTEDRAFT_186120 [Capitella teleta]